MPRRSGGFARALLLSVPLLILSFADAAAIQRRQLRVCADPNNLPFSNERSEGFENKLAELVADDLDATVSYTWRPQRRGFVRRTVKAHRCDVIMGVPSNYEPVLATKPYYSSSYVFVYAKDKNFRLRSLDDPSLRRLRIGVHAIGDDYANAPPVHALARRNIIENVVGYSMYGGSSEENPPARIIDAVRAGEIDVAIVWGPLAGYFAKRQPAPLEIVPVSPAIDPPGQPFAFDISMGVRRDDHALKRELDSVLDRRRDAIQRILHEYGVPLIGGDSAAPPDSTPRLTAKEEMKCVQQSVS